MAKSTKVNFSDLFNWAEKYGIGWNEANDVFFGNALTYGSYNEIACGDGIGYSSEYYNSGRRSWDLTREEIDALSNDEKSYILIDIYLHEKGIEEAIFLND